MYDPVYGVTHLSATLHTSRRRNTRVYGVTHLFNAARVEPVSLGDGVKLVWRQFRQLSLGAAALVDAVGNADAVLCGEQTHRW